MSARSRAWPVFYGGRKHPALRVAFDLDDTLIPVAHGFPTDPPSNLLLRWLIKERLRSGTRDLLRSLIADGHELWIYTTSLRPAWAIRLTFRAYGIVLGGVVNQADHAKWVRWPDPMTTSPSKYPPAFGIVGLTRFRGHLTRGGYDVQDDERNGIEAGAQAVLGGVQSRCRAAGFGRGQDGQRGGA